MMPGMSAGLTCYAGIRKTSNVPIIMLTAKGEEIDPVLGLELGAAHQIRSFSFSVLREVIARVKAVQKCLHNTG